MKEKFKLDKKLIAKVALFNAVVNFDPTVAYALSEKTIDMSKTSIPFGIYALLIGGFTLSTYKTIKNSKEERLYNICHNLIPNQNKIIKLIKSEAQGEQDNCEMISSSYINSELKSENNFLKYLEFERELLCESLNLDETNEQQMSEFFERIEKRLESENSRKKVKDKVLSLLQ